jgi:signal transduction histidine kinase
MCEYGAMYVCSSNYEDQEDPFNKEIRLEGSNHDPVTSIDDDSRIRPLSSRMRSGSLSINGSIPPCGPSDEDETIRSMLETVGCSAHNFLNLLQIILGAGRLALQDLDDGDTAAARENLARIIDGALMGESTARRIQRVARGLYDAEIAGRSDEQKTCDLSETVESAIDMMKPYLTVMNDSSSRQTTLVSDLANGCRVKGGREEIFDVAVNVIKNAIEALPDGGRVVVRTKRRSDEACLMVEDNGVGMEQDDMHKMFDPYWTTKGAKGNGIGLTGCLATVDRYGGHIRVKSRRGKGTIFTVVLPSA